MECCDSMEGIHRNIVFCSVCKHFYNQTSTENMVCPRCNEEYGITYSLDVVVDLMARNLRMALFETSSIQIYERTHEFLIDFTERIVKEQGKFETNVIYCTNKECSYQILSDLSPFERCPQCNNAVVTYALDIFIDGIMEGFYTSFMSNSRQYMKSFINVANNAILEIKETEETENNEI